MNTEVNLPEGPELLHSRDKLRDIIVGKFITRLIPSTIGRYRQKLPDGLQEIVKDLPLKILDVNTKGKFMWWTLQGKKTWYLWSTYGMSGQWSQKPNNHVGFVVEYNGSGILVTRDQQKLFFNDQRRFGTIKFVSNTQEHVKKLKTLGPDILENPPMAPELFAERILKNPNRTISEVLMDQSCVSGIGNYLKSEVLYRSGLSPHRDVKSLTSHDILRLYTQVIDCASESYAAQGASIRTYRTVDDSKGKAQFFFRVYGQKTCPNEHTILREETKDSRTSWWCSTCQK